MHRCNVAEVAYGAKPEREGRKVGTRTKRLLEHQRRLERAETLLHDLRRRLRERPENEHHVLKESLRLANRDASMARRALTDLIAESSGPAAETFDFRALSPVNGPTPGIAARPCLGHAGHPAKR